jgi:hypothetical protein
MNGSLEPGTQQPQPDETDLNRDEVQALIQSARRASEAGDDIILPRLDKGDREVDDTDQAAEEEDDDFEPGYWEASGMAPLNATSLVSPIYSTVTHSPYSAISGPRLLPWGSCQHQISTPDMVHLPLSIHQQHAPSPIDQPSYIDHVSPGRRRPPPGLQATPLPTMGPHPHQPQGRRPPPPLRRPPR